MSVIAICPVCGDRTATSYHHGRRIHHHHGTNISTGDSCVASGWLTEDDELLPVAPKHRGPK